MTPLGGCEEEGADLSEMPGRHTWHNKEFNAWRPCSHNGVAARALAQTKLGYEPEETLPITRENDNRFVHTFDRVADGTDAEVLTTPYQAPQANAICERFLGSVRRKCLDFFLILNERHLDNRTLAWTSPLSRLQ
jgi:hypothetical protein